MSTFIERHPWIVAILLIIAFGIVGQMDYEDARKQECAPRAYNAEKDACE